jgi:PadR family transcriptional regulator PadR
MGQSTLYPLLYNLEAQGQIRGEWFESESGRKRKYYSLPPKGKRRLAAETRQWQAVTRAMGQLGIIRTAGATTA